MRNVGTTVGKPPVPLVWRSKPRYSVQERAPPGRERKKTFTTGGLFSLITTQNQKNIPKSQAHAAKPGVYKPNQQQKQNGPAEGGSSIRN